MATYRLAGLDCAVCARDLETELAALRGVSSVSIDFASLSMRVEAEDLSLVEAEIRKREPGIALERSGPAALTGSLETKARATVRSAPAAAEVAVEIPAAYSLRRQIPLLACGALIGGFGIMLERGLVLAALPEARSAAGPALILLAWFIAGKDVLRSAARNLLRGRIFDELFLMSIATIGALVLGQFEEALEVMVFYKVGEMLQASATARSRRAIGSMLGLRPEFARVRRGGDWIEMAPEEAKVGDLLLLKPGERLALDAQVMEGTALVDDSALTGEALPKRAVAGGELLSGCLALDGALRLKALRPAAESQMARILSLVEEAAHAKSATERRVTGFAAIYTPIVLGLALGIAFLPVLLLPGQSLAHWAYRALVMLVISCPCALVISVPLGYFAGIGGAARRGILVKGGKALDRLAAVHTVVFDKTGTLTEGTFRVLDIRPRGISADELLSLAASAESLSRHPLAASILAEARKRGLVSWLEDEASGLREVPGAGLVASIGGRRVAVGNGRILEAEGAALPPDVEAAAISETATLVHVALDGIWAGCIALGDAVRTDARSAINALRDLGMRRMAILSGDSESATAALAASVGVDEYHGGLLPGAKVGLLRAMRDRPGAGGVAFVGDGINDAPSIAAADVGMAMGAGSDLAVESADVVLVTDQPSRVAEAIGRGRRTRRIIGQNIAFALGVKLLVMGLAALGAASMWEAVLADVGVALIAIANSLRALR